MPAPGHGGVRASIDRAPDPRFATLPRPAGWIERAARDEAGVWRLDGWAVLPVAPSGPFDALRAYWNGEEAGTAEPLDRPDVGRAVYWVPGARRGGFRLTLPPGAGEGRLELVGERRGRAVACLPTALVVPETEPVLPSDVLAERVSGLSGAAFRLSGLRAFTDLWDQVRAHRPPGRTLRVLDWGCGSGRVTRYLGRVEGVELHGCDIDAEAVAWCGDHLAGTFVRTELDPPLPYDDGRLDVVLASSIFTHLARSEQDRWLAELMRVLAPGGILVASVTGMQGALLGQGRRFRLGRPPGSLLDRVDASRRRMLLRRAGTVDIHLDHRLDGVAPPGYYRAVFQAPADTLRRWRRHGEVIAYVERGLLGHQDLVVLRPRRTAAAHAA